MIVIDDSEMLKLVQRGDREAMVALYDRYAPLAYSVALRILKTPATAEDVLQELFLQLWRFPQGIDTRGGSLYGWVVVAARNRAVSMLRKKQPVPLDGMRLASPFRAEESAQRKRTCEQLINAVPAELHTLLHMAFFQDMSYSEIAISTGIPLGTIKTRMRSALAMMKKSVALKAECRPSLPNAAFPLLLH